MRSTLVALAAGLVAGACSQSPEPSSTAPTGVSKQLVGATELELVYERSIGGYGTGPGQMAYPRGVAVDPVGRVFVSDSGNHRILRFDPAGVFLDEWGGLGFEPGRFHGPRDLVVGETLDLLVLDGENRRVVRYDLDGNLVGVALDLSPDGLGTFGWFELGGLGAAPWGTIFVTDTEGNRVIAYEPLNGTFRQVGGYGDQPGLFRRPTGVSVDDRGYLLVADGGNGRVQALDARGVFVRAWPLAATEVSGRVAVCWLDGGLLALAEEAASRITVLGSDGRTLAVHGKVGEEEGALRSPSALAFDRHQRLYVADTDNHRVSVFRLETRSQE